MVSVAVRRRLLVATGVVLIAVGAYAIVHPDHPRGASLVLLGIAILERGSNGTTRLLRRIAKAFDGELPRWSVARRPRRTIRAPQRLRLLFGY